MLQGRQVVGLVQPKNQRGMPDDAGLLGQRHRSRDQGTMSGGLNGDLSEQVGKEYQLRQGTDLPLNLNADISSKEQMNSEPLLRRKPHEAADGLDVEHEHEQEEGRPAGSSFETKRRSDLQASQPDVGLSAIDPAAPLFPNNDLDKASSAMSKTGRIAKNALAVQACMSAPSDPRATTSGSKQPHG